MRIYTLVAMIVLGSFASAAIAQQGNSQASQASPARPKIGVIDVGHILKNHPTMKTQIEAIQAKMDAADKEMTARRDAILAEMEQLRTMFNEGTAEYEAKEKEIAEKDTEFRLEILKRRKEFDRQRADLMYQIYKDIKTLVSYYCENTGMEIVLRVNATRATPEELDPSKPDTVQLLMGQEVVHFAANKNVDITDWVLKGLQAQTAQRSAATNR